MTIGSIACTEDQWAQAVAIFRAVNTSGPMPTLDELTVIYALLVLDAHGGNKTHAARALGIDRRSLYRLLERAPQVPKVCECGRAGCEDLS